MFDRNLLNEVGRVFVWGGVGNGLAIIKILYKIFLIKNLNISEGAVKIQEEEITLKSKLIVER